MVKKVARKEVLVVGSGVIKDSRIHFLPEKTINSEILWDSGDDKFGPFIGPDQKAESVLCKRKFIWEGCPVIVYQGISLL